MRVIGRIIENPVLGLFGCLTSEGTIRGSMWVSGKMTSIMVMGHLLMMIKDTMVSGKIVKKTALEE